MADSNPDNGDGASEEEVKKDKDIAQKKDPDLSVTHGQASEPMKTEEFEEKRPNAACVAALDTILKSLRKIKVFLSDVMMLASRPGTHQRYADVYLGKIPDHFLRNQSLTRPLEENGVTEIFVTVLDLLPLCTRHFEVNETKVKKNCSRCKMDTEYPQGPYYGIIIIENSLRETKYVLEHFSFEKILKVIRIKLEMPCKNEGCGKRSYVQGALKKLPSVFTIALEWENNETRGEIDETVSVLATEIDIIVIYQFDGECPDTKYHLVSMVCLHGDQYNCIAYENNRWVRHFGAEEEVIGGDWESVLGIFTRMNIRPEILYFDNDNQRELVVNLETFTKCALDWMLAQQQ